MLHLDADFEHIGQHLDELAEINSLVGDIIEDGLVAVALVFHITDFHFQTEVHGYLPRTNHGVGLTRLGLLESLKVGGLCLAEHAQDFGVGAQVGPAHLQLDELAGHGHLSDVVARVGFHGHHVAHVQVELGRVAVEPAARVLEVHLDDVEVVHVAGNVVEPVGAAQVASAIAAAGAHLA